VIASDCQNRRSGGLFEKIFHYYLYRQEEFRANYYKRSNIETTNRMAKRWFDDQIRSRTGVAMRNELYAKLLCHNFCCVTLSQIELGI
jgi:transposase